MRFSYFATSICAVSSVAALGSDGAAHQGFMHEKRACSTPKPVTVTKTSLVTVFRTVGNVVAIAATSKTKSTGKPGTSKPPPSSTRKSTAKAAATSSIRSSAATAPTSAVPSGITTTYTGPTSGTATFYGNDGTGGNCKLPARSDLMFVAWPGAQWKSSEYCGACLQVKGDKGTVNVQITNKWYVKAVTCPAGNLDLSTAAFNKIVSTSGVGPISWKFVDCTGVGLENGKLSFFWKSGSSQYWAGIQVRGAGKPIKSVEIGGRTLVRQDYNYFLAESGLGAGPYTVKTIFQDGTSVTTTGVPLNGNVENA